jgi:type IV pilus assembly protein PilN
MTVQLNINLASKPYVDVRSVLLRWGTWVLLLAVCTVALVSVAVSGWRQTRAVEAQAAQVQSEINALDRERSEAQKVLDAPDNSLVEERSKFFNRMIARKTFSWTRVFMQMEQIMPANLHVASIAPELHSADNSVTVHLTVAGTSRDAAVELVKRLEQSPAFRDARIVEGTEIHEKESVDTVRFQLTATYVPIKVHLAEPGNAATAKGGAR